MPKEIEHVGTRWTEPNGKLHVVVEHPDFDGLELRAEILREAGYEVAMCSGPQAGSRRNRTTCPLVVGGSCTLIEHADVVVTTCLLRDADEIIDKLTKVGAPLVVETSQTTTPHELLTAVASKLATA
jgi:hypothetical protein